MAEDVSIRRAGPEDVSEIVSLNHSLFQEDAGTRDPYTNLNWPREGGSEYFSGLLGSERVLCLLAESGGETVGYLVGYKKEKSSLRPVDAAELESMYVREGYRSLGVGKRLVDEFLRWLGQQGVERVSVTAYAANERAISFYEKLGFEPKNLSLEMGVPTSGRRS